jgi:hypothetical protein
MQIKAKQTLVNLPNNGRIHEGLFHVYMSWR